jgi:hypothetical protein
MDKITRSWYEMRLQLTMREKRFNEFQDFFNTIMELRYPADFQRVRPWGDDGDRKNDGYLKSERRLFQVYAPNQIQKVKTISKMEEDFHGALPYWEKYFSVWTFVHNSFEGLAGDVLATLLSLGEIHPDVSTCQWGCSELRSHVFALTDEDIEFILGPALTEQSVREVRFDDVKVVVESIASGTVGITANLGKVPPGKINTNALSEDVECLIVAGVRKAPLVKQFFQQWYDPTLGDRVAEGFNRRYLALRDEGNLPDAIFHQLQIFAGLRPASTPREQAAILAVLAHFFEECDIFERPRDRILP